MNAQSAQPSGVKESFRLFAHRAAEVVGSAWAFFAAVLVILVWVVTGPIYHFSDTWQLVINTGATVVTCLMVFLIQNSQNREARAIRLKLDELLRAVEGARNHLIELDDMTDEQLDALQREFERLRRRHDELHSSKTHH